MDETDDLPLVSERPSAELARADDAAPEPMAHGKACTERSRRQARGAGSMAGACFPAVLSGLIIVEVDTDTESATSRQG
jgi:hypothetical protein